MERNKAADELISTGYFSELADTVAEAAKSGGINRNLVYELVYADEVLSRVTNAGTKDESVGMVDMSGSTQPLEAIHSEVTAVLNAVDLGKVQSEGDDYGKLARMKYKDVYASGSYTSVTGNENAMKQLVMNYFLPRILLIVAAVFFLMFVWLPGERPETKGKMDAASVVVSDDAGVVASGSSESTTEQTSSGVATSIKSSTGYWLFKQVSGVLFGVGIMGIAMLLCLRMAAVLMPGLRLCDSDFMQKLFPKQVLHEMRGVCTYDRYK